MIIEPIHRVRMASVPFWALGLILVAGCGGYKRIPVSGTVTLDGKPFTGGVIQFVPDVSKGNEKRAGCVSPVSNGKFNLVTTGVYDVNNGPGAPLGWYKVYLTFPDGNPPPGLKIHERFLDPDKTPIEVEIVENAPPGTYDIKFTSK